MYPALRMSTRAFFEVADLVYAAGESARNKKKVSAYEHVAFWSAELVFIQVGDFSCEATSRTTIVTELFFLRFLIHMCAQIQHACGCQKNAHKLSTREGQTRTDVFLIPKTNGRGMRNKKKKQLR